MALGKDQINNLVKEFIDIKKRFDNIGDNEKQYKVAQNNFVKKMHFLVKRATCKYAKFSNYPDLQQDANEALMASVVSFEPGRGDFKWWAEHYINTKVSRSANKHSTIKIPLKKAKEMQPYKTNEIPVLVDDRKDPSEYAEDIERKEYIRKAIMNLPEQQRKIILAYYEFNDTNPSVSKISKSLNISRPTFIRLLEEAQNNLRTTLAGLNI